MTALVLSVAAAMIAALGGCVWLVVCSHERDRDLRNMLRILSKLQWPDGMYSSDPEIAAEGRRQRDAANELEARTIRSPRMVRKHYWYRVFLRDPRDLYPLVLWPAFKRNDK